MIYNKPKKIFHLSYKDTHFKSLNEWKPETNAIYYFHPYDELQSGISLINAVDEIHWEHLRSEPTAKFLYENCGETFTFEVANQIKSLIELKQIPPNKIFMLVMDKVHKLFIEDRFKELNVQGVTIGIYNVWFELTKIIDVNFSPKSFKFSALSRRYVPWRLHLYALLVKKKLLNNFIYSFNNIHPYGDVIHYSKDTMLNDLNETKFGEINSMLFEWLDKVPYTLPGNVNVKNGWENTTYNAIVSADIHLLIESQYDFFYVPKGPDNMYNRNLAPSCMSEKFYKTISCERPFIAFSTPYFLEQVRELGFETFSPYINEEYDLELDHNKRADMIVSEVERISNLSNNEYQILLEECNAIAKQNKKLFLSMKKDKIYNQNFNFLIDHWKVLHIIH